MQFCQFYFSAKFTQTCEDFDDIRVLVPIIVINELHAIATQQPRPSGGCLASRKLIFEALKEQHPRFELQVAATNDVEVTPAKSSEECSIVDHARTAQKEGELLKGATHI